MTRYKKLSHRVGYADFAIPGVDNTKGLINIGFIVVYEPTTPSVQKDARRLEKFYDTKSRAKLTKRAECSCILFVISTVNSALPLSHVLETLLKAGDTTIIKPL